MWRSVLGWCRRHSGFSLLGLAGLFAAVLIPLWQAGVLSPGDGLTEGIAHGSLIRNDPDPNVYQVKRVDGKIFRRLIVSRAVMKANDWTDRDVDDDVTQPQLAAIPISNLVRLAGAEAVYELTLDIDGDQGSKRQVSASLNQLERMGQDPDSVFDITLKEFRLYD